VLNVSSNQLKLLPDSIGQLERLCILNASSNHLKALPDSIGNLKCLQCLDLRDNKHLKVLPASLAQATCLKDLNLDSRRFEYPPEEIAVQGSVVIMHFLSEGGSRTICKISGEDYLTVISSNIVLIDHCSQAVYMPSLEVVLCLCGCQFGVDVSVILGSANGDCKHYCLVGSDIT
jgi:Leucine-rich repeat (LRR) protein